MIEELKQLFDSINESPDRELLPDVLLDFRILLKRALEDLDNLDKYGMGISPRESLLKKISVYREFISYGESIINDRTPHM